MLLTLSFVYSYIFMKNASTEAATKKYCFGHSCLFVCVCVYVCVLMFIDFLFYFDFNTNTDLVVYSWFIVIRL